MRAVQDASTAGSEFTGTEPISSLKKVTGSKRLAKLIAPAKSFADKIRPANSDPVLHSGLEALEAAEFLVHLSANLGSDYQAYRIDQLHEALNAIRAAEVAIRFAIAAEGDRSRQIRMSTVNSLPGQAKDYNAALVYFVSVL